MSGSRDAKGTTPTVAKTEAEWSKLLTPREYAVLRKQYTEERNAGYTKCKDEGVYVCKACETPLFTSDQKFDSGCGWPAFDDCLPGAVLTRADDDGHRVEIICAGCHSHLGHVFKGERFTDTNTRHCVNSICLRLRAKVEAPAESNE